jgi:hypothetical protein
MNILGNLEIEKEQMMRRGGLLFVCLILLLTFLLASPVLAQEKTVNLTSHVIESFDNPENPEEAEWASSEWLINASKFATEVTDEDGNVVRELPESTYVESWPEALFGRNAEGRELRVFGIHGRFDRQGYNYIELIPAILEDGELVPRHPDITTDAGDFIPGNEITLPGETRRLDLWVWGSNYDYYLDVHLRDYRGVVHALRLGDIDYTGWRNLSVNIPTYIPQTGGYITGGGFLKELKLVKLVLWTRPHERVNDFYVYFDHIKSLSDMFVTRFDGDILAEKDRIQEIWNSGEGR